MVHAVLFEWIFAEVSVLVLLLVLSIFSAAVDVFVTAAPLRVLGHLLHLDDLIEVTTTTLMR